eukprot:scaffold785_cov335-Pavlova_lutheri.AAC.2
MEDCWSDHSEQMLTIRSIFLYLDRTYVLQSANVRSLWDMGLVIFREYLLQHKQVESTTTAGILQLIEKERLGESVDRPLLRNLLRMFSALGLYAESFEKQFLVETAEFYATESSRLLQEVDVPSYFKHVEDRLQEESDRCNYYLDASTRKQLVLTVEKQLIEEHANMQLDRGFASLMDENRLSDLARLYSLLDRVNMLDQLKGSLVAYVKVTGSAIVMDEEKDKEMVQSLLSMKAKVDHILVKAFQNNETFTSSLKEAFEHFINQRQNRPAELIAKYVDAMMRSGNKTASDEELESLLDRLLVLFRYIQGKDVFEAFYKKDLAKRLLLSKSASIDLEKSMIMKLKAECGSQFTNKLEGMFKDIDLSQDIMTQFRQSPQFQDRLPSNMELNVSVLTTGYWPTYTPMEVRLPEELTTCQDLFKDFYVSKHNGRRLMWQSSLGHCVMRVQFPKGLKELHVSLFQCVVLMLFNDAESLSYKEIEEATGIESTELQRTMLSLACGKPSCRILLKSPKSKEIAADDDKGQLHSDERNGGGEPADKRARVPGPPVPDRCSNRENNEDAKKPQPQSADHRTLPTAQVCRETAGPEETHREPDRSRVRRKGPEEFPTLQLPRLRRGTGGNRNGAPRMLSATTAVCTAPFIRLPLLGFLPCCVRQRFVDGPHHGRLERSFEDPG